MRNGQLNNGFSIFIQFFKSSMHPLSTGKLLKDIVSFSHGRSPHYTNSVFTYTTCNVLGLCKRLVRCILLLWLAHAAGYDLLADSSFHFRDLLVARESDSHGFVFSCCVSGM